MCAILSCILVGLSLDFFFHLSLPTLKSGHPFSRLGFCNLNVPLLNTFHAFPGVCFFFSHASCLVLLHLCVAVLFYLFVFKIVSSHTLCILLYSAPLSLRATDVANGNANGGRNNALSSTVSRPMPHSTSPSPGCAAGDQGKRKPLCFFILSCTECWAWNLWFCSSSDCSCFYHSVFTDPFAFWHDH